MTTATHTRQFLHSSKHAANFFLQVVAVFVSICIAVVSSTTSGSSGPCESIGNDYLFSFGNLKTCFMSSTAIDSAQFSITSARNETAEGFRAYNNKKMKYLPANLGEKFPNLVFLLAFNCSIKQISKETFKSLSKLRVLHLDFNQIDKIDDDAFEGISAVEQIWLDDNKIKKLNSRAFASLSKLKTVYLNDNDCIDEDFVGAERIAEMRRVVNEKCGFTEAPKPNACGVPMKVAKTIVKGESFDRGDFPWMVALYRRLKLKRPKYICGGSVISDQHVLTAAHCLEDRVPREITALFGAHDLDDHLEVDRLAKSPSRIFMHDHWNPQTGRVDADIAMLLMPQQIVFSIYVQPICLWDSLTAPAASTGIVPGWGKSQNTSRDHEMIPTMLELPLSCRFLQQSNILCWIS